jgi:hypothetical protein
VRGLPLHRMLGSSTSPTTYQFHVENDSSSVGVYHSLKPNVVNMTVGKVVAARGDAYVDFPARSGSVGTE